VVAEEHFPLITPATPVDFAAAATIFVALGVCEV
jgi:hypothetical protein